MDQITAMRAFVRVVQTGSFSAVARESDTGQATISKRVAGLESLLGVKLLNRSSRDISLTEPGQSYYDKAVVILAELDEAEAEARSQTVRPQGTLRISAPIPFGRMILAPLLPEFLERYPTIQVDLMLNDKFVDLISEGIDVAIRAKQLEDSSLIARPLFENPMRLIAAPSYLQRYGRPEKPEQLSAHNCLVYSLQKSGKHWPFKRQQKSITVTVNGNFQCDNGDTLLEMARAGSGIAQLPIWMIDQHLKAGQLTTLLDDYQADAIPFHAIYPKHRYTPLKVRSFIDFIKAKIDDNPLFTQANNRVI
jgi:DNA-binding transcriptional LysR family regulator